jgi:hypothetical protein
LLDQSVNRFGYVEPLIVDERSGRLAAGHGRSKTVHAKKLAGEAPPVGVKVDEKGRWCLPVVRGVAFSNDEEHEAYLVASNQIVMIAGGWLDDGAQGRPDHVGAQTPQGLRAPGSTCRTSSGWSPSSTSSADRTRRRRRRRIRG